MKQPAVTFRRLVLWSKVLLCLALKTGFAQETPDDPLAEIDEPSARDGLDEGFDEFDDFDEFGEYDVPAVNDPFEGFNRSVLKFNNTAIKYGLRPVANAYEATVPDLARRGLRSFFDNLGFPVRFISCVLQGKVDRASRELAKFLINTTAGVGGFFDVAGQHEELRVPSEDLGQTFGTWGFGSGPFLVLPILGPSSLRDVAGMGGEWFLSPSNEQLIKADWEIRWGYSTGNTITALPGRLQQLDELNAMALDPYIALRNGYTQFREAEVAR